MRKSMAVLAAIAALAVVAALSGCGGSNASPSSASSEASAPVESSVVAPVAGALAPGEYEAEFNTDSSMFHVNETQKGLGTLTVKDGKMTIHITLASKNIVNLFPGLKADAQKEGAALLQPTVDTVTYEDGTTEEVYGFDVPVPAIGEEFDLALIGKAGKWYDHKVIVTNPVPEA